MELIAGCCSFFLLLKIPDYLFSKRGKGVDKDDDDREESLHVDFMLLMMMKKMHPCFLL